MPRYSIITPTLLRDSLKKTCDSIDEQTNSDWQHIVVVDLGPEDYVDKLAILRQTDNDRRRFIFCNERHNDFGHTCRYKAWQFAEGDYLLYVDDDDFLADSGVLKELEQVIAPWAVFPVLWHGQIFFNLPPGFNRTGTGMFIVRREIGRWPADHHEYAADGAFVEQLVAKHPYQALKEARPLVVLPESLYGK